MNLKVIAVINNELLFSILHIEIEKELDNTRFMKDHNYYKWKLPNLILNIYIAIFRYVKSETDQKSYNKV